MKNIWNFICENNTMVMIVGRFIIFICAILLIAEMLNKNPKASTPWVVIIIGVIIWGTGWIARFADNKKKAQKKVSQDEPVDLESL